MEIKENKIRLTILTILLIVIVCFAVVPKRFQNDTFYTIKIGKYILDNGITMKDPFSWHDDLDYTYPHWAYDVITYLAYSIGNFRGVYIFTVVQTIILGLVLYFSLSKLMKNQIMPFIVTVLTIILLKSYITARAQLVTFILFVLTIYFIESFLQTGKKRYAIGLIIIPILIANIHIAVFPFYFVLYLPYIGEYIVFKLLNFYKLKTNQERKKEPYKIILSSNNYTWMLIVIMVICMFTGLLTPLKSTPYTYLIKTMQGNTTKNISEHLPLVLIDHIEVLILLVVYIAILAFTDTKIRLSDFFLVGGLTLLALMTRRQESMLILLGSFVLTRLLCNFLNKYDKNGIQDMERLMVKPLGIIIAILLIVSISMKYYIDKMDSEYVDEKNYPVKASEWILENIDLNTAKLYNEYNFGSYLLFKDIPVFIDSRADLYAPEFNGKKDIFMDFINISTLNLKNIQEKLDEYGFTHFICKKNARLTIFLELKPDEYSKIYADDYFAIYEKI